MGLWVRLIGCPRWCGPVYLHPPGEALSGRRQGNVGARRRQPGVGGGHGHLRLDGASRRTTPADLGNIAPRGGFSTVGPGRRAERRAASPLLARVKWERLSGIDIDYTLFALPTPQLHAPVVDFADTHVETYCFPETYHLQKL